MPAFVRIAAPNGDVATLAVKKWVGNGAPQYAAGFQQDFITHYVDPQEGYAKITALAGEFSNIAKVSDLPNKTPGYQRKSQTVLGIATPYTGSTSTPATADQARAVVLTALAWGQEGGNDITAQIVNPGTDNAALGVSVSGKAITVNAATDATGAVTSTAAQVVDAINATPAAAALVTAASTAPTRAPAWSTAQAAPSKLSDWLNAPATYPRGPQTVKMLRIGNDVGKPQGQKTGVFIYCQEHAREWGTPLVCLETAERLVRNYATDPETKSLVDNLDIFIVPTINADGAAYSMYDYNTQRKNMVNYCASNPTGNNDPYARNSWGVDLNRNFSVGSGFDGFVGGGTGCTGETFQGPSEMSEPEVRNEAYIQSTYSNIKFAMNVHSSGGYFMWPPGAYTPDRTTLPYPPYGTLNYFDQTAAAVLDRIYNYRHTAILPQQTGPVADVLYSAAGNSADEAYYNHGIIGYDFEIGASKVLANGQSQGTGFQPCYGAVGTGGRHRHLQRQPRQRGPRRGHGVRKRQLRAARLRAAVLERHRGAGRRHHGHVRRQDAHLLGQVHEQRGVLDLLHHRRLDADHGLHRVEAEPAARAAGRARPRPRHDAEVDRRRLQGQHVRGQVADPRPDRHARHGRRQRPGDAGADAGRPGDVRRVHPGRRQGLHGHHHGDRDLHRR